MATQELRELRHRYKEAYTTYMSCVQMVSDASQQGTWPAKEHEQREENAFQALVFTRQTLLDALYAHSKSVK